LGYFLTASVANCRFLDGKQRRTLLPMARKPRLHIPGALYHVTLRGNDKQDIFFEKYDRTFFYNLLGEGVKRFGHRIHAFCLMTNHVHLAMEVANTPLSSIVQNVAFRYTRFINRRYQRVGHLFQGRYHALLVDADSYFLELVRYIHLNPVRAKLVADPSTYLWSSHRVYLGMAELSWLTTNTVLGEFGTRRSQSVRRYARFIADLAPDISVIPTVNSADSRIIGDDDFRRRVSDLIAKNSPSVPKLEDVIAAVCLAYQMDFISLKRPNKQRTIAEARAVIAYLAYDLGAATGVAVASTLDCASDTIYKAALRLRKRLDDDQRLRRRVAAIRSQIS